MVFMPILVTFSRLFVISGELEICVQGRSPFCSTLIFFFFFFFFYFILDFKKKKTVAANKQLLRKRLSETNRPRTFSWSHSCIKCF